MMKIQTKSIAEKKEKKQRVPDTLSLTSLHHLHDNKRRIQTSSLGDFRVSIYPEAFWV